MSYILKVNDLCHSYGGNTPFINDAISNISFGIERGQIVGIIGHTGSGKSTLVQHLNGLLKPTSGEIFIDDKNIWDDPKKIKEIRSRVGLVFQYPEYQLFEETVFKDIAYGPHNMGLNNAEIDKRVKDICEIVKIPQEYFEKSPFDLSGGEKRRVAIAGVMAMQPEIIVFDEPVAGLDPVGRQDIVDIIRNYRDKYGATVLIVSHNMEDMAVLADKLLVLNSGKLFMFDTTDNVFKSADKLRSIGLNVPIVTRVLEELKSEGVDIRTDIFTVDKAVNYLTGLCKGGASDA